MKYLNNSHIVGGLMVLIGGGAALIALTYKMGTLTRMGPGYFPMVLGVILLIIGVLIIAFDGKGPATGSIHYKGLIPTILGILAFSFTIDRFGLAPAVFLSTLLCSAGMSEFRPLRAILLAIGLAIGTVLVFRYMIGLQIPAFKW